MTQITPTGQSITIIHFVYPLSDGPPPDYRIACMPNMVEFHTTMYHPNYPRSNLAEAVTCPACKATAQYKSSLGKIR